MSSAESIDCARSVVSGDKKPVPKRSSARGATGTFLRVNSHFPPPFLAHQIRRWWGVGGFLVFRGRCARLNPNLQFIYWNVQRRFWKVDRIGRHRFLFRRWRFLCVTFFAEVMKSIDFARRLNFGAFYVGLFRPMLRVPLNL